MDTVALSPTIVQFASGEKDLLVTRSAAGVTITVYGADSIDLTFAELRLLVQFLEFVGREENGA